MVWEVDDVRGEDGCSHGEYGLRVEDGGGGEYGVRGKDGVRGEDGMRGLDGLRGERGWCQGGGWGEGESGVRG